MSKPHCPIHRRFKTFRSMRPMCYINFVISRSPKLWLLTGSQHWFGDTLHHNSHLSCSIASDKLGVRHSIFPLNASRRDGCTFLLSLIKPRINRKPCILYVFNTQPIKSCQGSIEDYSNNTYSPPSDHCRCTPIWHTGEPRIAC